MKERTKRARPKASLTRLPRYPDGRPIVEYAIRWRSTGTNARRYIDRHLEPGPGYPFHTLMRVVEHRYEQSREADGWCEIAILEATRIDLAPQDAVRTRTA